VLLGSGALVVVAAGAASLSDVGAVGRGLVAVLAGAAAAGSVGADRRQLRATAEVLAGSAAVLAVIASWSPAGAGHALVLAGLAALLLALRPVSPSIVAWPVAAWLVAQLGVLSALHPIEFRSLPHVAAVLGTALAGLLVTGVGRRPVAVVALGTTAPWWAAGVLEGQGLLWADGTGGGSRALAAALLVAAAAALLAVRSRRLVRPLLGPRPAVPVLCGLVAGAGVAGALSAGGPAGVPAVGYLGLALAALVASVASPRPDAVLRPAGLSAASTLTGLAVAQLLGDARWGALALLLVAAAVPALLVAARQPADRPGALPVAVGCLAGAGLLADAARALTPRQAAWCLLALAVASLSGAGLLRRQHPELPLAVAGTVVGGVGLLVIGYGPALAPPLAVLGAALTGYGTVAGRRGARAAGCAALVAAAWLIAATAGMTVVEAWSLPAAAGLLLFSGRRLADAPSWPSWGPALAAAFVPSGTLAVVEPGTLRLLLVVAAATLATTLGAVRAVQAPFVVGAVSLVAVAVGRLVAALPWPGLVAVAGAGVLLLAIGAGYEQRRRQAAAAVGHVTDMR
jgi:hypothetical protein